MIKRLLIIGFFFITIISHAGEYDFSKNCLDARKAIVELRFDEARRMSRYESLVHPDNLVPFALENTIDCIALFISEEKATYNYLLDTRDQRLKKLNSGDKSSPYFRFFLGQYFIEWAFVRFKFGDRTGAALELGKAYRYFEENEKLFPRFSLNRIGTGLVRVAFGLVPDQYKWFTGLLGFHGDTEDGLRDIASIVYYKGGDAAILSYQSQAIFYYSFISINLQRDLIEAKTIDHFMAANFQEWKKSPLLIYARASLLVRLGLNSEALQVLKERKKLGNCFSFFYLDYLEGVLRLNNLDLNAETNFLFYLDHFKGDTYRISALRRLAWISLLRGDKTAYSERMREITHMQSPVSDDDQSAHQAAKEGEIPDVLLLKARLLFDGGNYDAAMTLLTSVDPVKAFQGEQNILEYYYRTGRIYHAKEHPDKALQYYRMAIERGKEKKWYFAASAAYQSGLIFESRREMANAAIFYRLCLSMPVEEYRASLRQKAKAGLVRIKANG